MPGCKVNLTAARKMIHVERFDEAVDIFLSQAFWVLCRYVVEIMATTRLGRFGI